MPDYTKDVTLLAIDPGVSTGLVALRKGWGRWSLLTSDTLTLLDLDQQLGELLMRLTTWGNEVRCPLVASVERLPQLVDVRVAAAVNAVAQELSRRSVDTGYVSPGTWKPWVRGRGYPPAWEPLYDGLQTVHERDAMGIACWTATHRYYLHPNDWEARA